MTFSRYLATASATVLVLAMPAQAQDLITLDLNLGATPVITGANVNGFTTAIGNDQFQNSSILTAVQNSIITAETGTALQSSITIDDNLLRAVSRGNLRDFEADIGANDGTLGILSAQLTTQGVVARVTNSNLAATFDSSTASMASLSENTIEAQTTVNMARNIITGNVQANENILGGTSLSAALDPMTLRVLDIEGGAGVVAGNQTLAMTSGAGRATVIGSTIEIDLDAMAPTNTAGDSRLSVNENRLFADLTGNRASLGVNLEIDTSVDANASFGAFNQQIITDVDGNDITLVAANATNSLSIDIGNVEGSTVEVSGNEIGSRFRGNVTAPMMPLEVVDGDDDPVATRSGSFVVINANAISTAGTTNNTSFDGSELTTTAQIAAVTQQIISGGGDGILRARTDNASLTVEVGTVGENDNPVNLELDGNTISADAVANTGNTLVELDAATSLATTATSVNDQSLSGAEVLGRVSNAVITATIGTEINGSDISVDENRITTVSGGNLADTQLAASAGTLMDRVTSAGETRGRIFFGSSDAVEFFDFNLVNRQDVAQDAPITATAGSVLSITADGVASTDGKINDSALSISENRQRADAFANAASNVISSVGDGDEDTATQLTAFLGLSNQQEAASAVEATSTLAIALPGHLLASRSTASDNRSIATASLNDATNTLTAMATSISDPDVNASAVNHFGIVRFDVGQPLMVRGSMAIGSEQIGGGGATATATLNIGNNDPINLTPLVQETGLQQSALSGESNRAEARVDGNTVSNMLRSDASTDQERTSIIGAFQDQLGDLTATANLSVDFGLDMNDQGGSGLPALADSTARLVGNQSVAQAIANEATTQLEHSGLNITGPVSGRASIGSGGLGTPGSDADRILAAVGVATLQTSSAETTAAAESQLTFSVEDPLYGLEISRSAITLDENATRAIARSNVLSRDAEASSLTVMGENVDGTSAAFGQQEATGAVSASATSTADMSLIAGGGVVVVGESALSVSDNITSAVASQNTADLSSTIISMNLSGEAGKTGTTANPNIDTASINFGTSPDGNLVKGDNILLMEQLASASTSAVASFVANNTVAGGGLAAVSTIRDSSIATDGNIVVSTSTANANNLLLDISADASANAVVAALANRQTVGVDADVTSLASFTANTVLANSNLESSSITTSDNIALSSAIGNSSVARLRAHGGALSGTSVTLREAATLFGTSTNRFVEADQVLASLQNIDSAVTSTANVDATIGGINQADQSRSAVDGNIANATAAGLESNLTLEVGAATTLDGTSALHNEQRAAENNVVSSNAALNLGVAGIGDPSVSTQMKQSAFTIDGNTALTSAIGSDARLRSVISATSISAEQDVGPIGSVGDSTGELVASGANVLTNVQTRAADATVTSIGSLDAGIFSDVDESGLEMEQSSASISGNTVDSTAIGNRVNSEHLLNAATGLSAGGISASWQQNEADITSTVTVTGTIGRASDLVGDMTSASAQLDDNIGVARASGNDARQLLNIGAGTSINGVGGGASSTSSALNAASTAAADYVVLNGQRNTAAVDATITSALNATRGVMNSSSVSVSDNIMLANAVGNRSVGIIEASRTASASAGSMAMGNTQVNTGDVTALATGTFNATLGTMDSSSTRVSGNTVSASATGNSSVGRLRRD